MHVSADTPSRLLGSATASLLARTPRRIGATCCGRRRTTIAAAAASGSKPFSVQLAQRREFNEVADAFITAFFLDGDAFSLPEAARRRLVSAAVTDLDRRYGRPGQRALFIVRDGGNDVVGCVGVEAATFEDGLPLARSRRTAAPPLRPLSAAAAAASQKPSDPRGGRAGARGDGLVQRPLVANLAVAASARRRGLAAALMRAAEGEARGWGFGEIVLLVDSRNARAQRLYRKLGYRQEGPGLPARVVGIRDGAVVEEEASNVLMRKGLKLPAALWENADPVSTALALAAAATLWAAAGGGGGQVEDGGGALESLLAAVRAALPGGGGDA